MFEYIRKQFNYTDYQIAQLRYFSKVVKSELSKSLIIGFFFINKPLLYIWYLFVFKFVRGATGGIHCKTYISCLTLSALFTFLCINILPDISISRTLKLLLLFVCLFVSCSIGPVVSSLHTPLAQKAINYSKFRLMCIITLHILLLLTIKHSTFINAGFWVIISNTIQLTICWLRKEKKNEKDST